LHHDINTVFVTIKIISGTHTEHIATRIFITINIVQLQRDWE